MKDAKAYMSLESYNYLKSGWVGQVLVHEINRDFVTLKAAVQSLQSTNKLNSAWVCTKKKVKLAR